MVDKKYVSEVFARLKKNNPNAKIELDYTNAYTLLVAVVLSAQSTDKGVNKATPALFKVADNPSKMLKLGLEGLIEHIKTIGLYNNKGKNIMLMSQMLVDKYAGQVPKLREELESLPGVGRKSANVILNVIFGQSTIAVDTHILRIAPRMGLTKVGNPLEVEEGLLKIIPEQYLKQAHHLLVLHGRYICKAAKPECENCPLGDICPKIGL
jgi:endonuclease-3